MTLTGGPVVEVTDQAESLACQKDGHSVSQLTAAQLRYYTLAGDVSWVRETTDRAECGSKVQHNRNRKFNRVSCYVCLKCTPTFVVVDDHVFSRVPKNIEFRYQIVRSDSQCQVLLKSHT